MFITRIWSDDHHVFLDSERKPSWYPLSRFFEGKGSCLLGLVVLGEVGDTCEMCGYAILESCQRYSVDCNQTECGVFERLLSSFLW